MIREFTALLLFPALVQAQTAAEVCRLQDQILGEGWARGGASQRAGLLAERLKLLQKLMREDPRAALSAALTPDQMAALGPLAEGRVEQAGLWEGELVALSADDFEGGRAETRYWLVREEETLEIFPTEPPEPAACGAKARLEGIRVGKAAAGILTVQDSSLAAAASECRPVGAQKILVVPVLMPGSETFPMGKAQIEAAYFGAEAPSLTDYWREASYGKAWAEGEVLDPLRLEAAYNCNQTQAMLDAVWSQLRERSGIETFSHIALLFPWPAEGCGFAGLGTVGCLLRGTPGQPNNRAGVHWIPLKPGHAISGLARVAIHEGGHNLGLRHASSMKYGLFAAGPPGQPGEHAEYGDLFSAMGSGLGHYNARQKRQLGWLEAGETLPVEEPGSYLIEPLASASTGAKSLRVLRSKQPAEWIWLEGRTREGAYEGTLDRTAAEGALVHAETVFNLPVQGAAYPGSTHLLDMTPKTAPNGSPFADARLAPGERWDDPFSPLSLTATRDPETGQLRVETAYAAACATLSTTELSHGAEEASGQILVQAPPDCRWTAVSLLPWLSLERNGEVREGSAAIGYAVERNQSSRARSGWFAVARTAVVIRQSAFADAPGVLSVTPEEGSGSFAGLTALFTDPNGPEDLRLLRVSIGAQPGAAGSCTVEYDTSAATVRLLGDDGEQWLGPAPASQASALKNASCRVISFYCYLTGGS